MILLILLAILIGIMYLFAFTLACTATDGDELNTRVGLDK